VVPFCSAAVGNFHSALDTLADPGGKLHCYLQARTGAGRFFKNSLVWPVTRSMAKEAASDPNSDQSGSYRSASCGSPA